jgi:DNA-binding beta-propeller fold protein YncE
MLAKLRTRRPPRAPLASAVAGLVALGAATSAPAATLGVYVTNQDSASLSQYDMGAGGLLRAKTPGTVATGTSPVGVALSADGRSAYVTNYGLASVSQYDVGAGGVLTPKTPPTVASSSGAFGVAVSPSGRSVYVTNFAANTVSQYDVGGGGVLTAKIPPTVAAGTNPQGVAVSADGRSVYVTNYGASSVTQYDVGVGETLSAKPAATVPAGTNPYGLAVSPDGRSVYVTNYGVSSVGQYDVGAGGALALKTPTAVASGTSPVGITISPDGRSVYVANVNANSVSQYNVGTDGALTAKSPPTVATGGGPLGVTVSPDGQSLYVSAHAVFQYDVGAGGALAPKAPAQVDAGTRPNGVAVAPDQGPVASFTAGPAPAGSPSSFDASASADHDGSVVRYAWDFGDGSAVATTTSAVAQHAYAGRGVYTVRLTVTDDAGCSAAFVFTGQTAYCNGNAAGTTTRTITVPEPTAVPGGGVAADTVAPVVSGYTLTRKSFVVSRRPTSRAGSAARTKKGTTFRYVLSEAATAKVLIAQRRPGRRKGRRCVAPSRRLSKAKRCTRLTTRGTLTRTSRQGPNRVAFSGRIGSKALSPGRYQATLTATDGANNSSPPRAIFFTIVPR